MSLWERPIEQTVFFGAIAGITQGCSIMMSQRFGANDIPGLWKSITMYVWLCIARAVVLTAGGQIVLRPLLVFLNTPENVLDGAVLYLRLCISGNVL